METRDSILIECAEDYVGLWAIVWDFRNSGSETEDTTIREKTISLVEELLKEQLIKAGNLNEEGNFEFWELPPTEIIRRIENEWDALGREPNIGEIVWFVATRKGQQEANVLSQK